MTDFKEETFESVINKSESVTLNKLTEFVGFLKGAVKEHSVQFNNDYIALLMIDPKTGKEVKLIPGGTAKYFAQNVGAKLGICPPAEEKDVERDAACIGHLVKISKTGEYTNKRGQKITTWSVLKGSKTLSDAPKPEPEAPTTVDSIPF